MEVDHSSADRPYRTGGRASKSKTVYRYDGGEDRAGSAGDDAAGDDAGGDGRGVGAPESVQPLRQSRRQAAAMAVRVR
jgi:hypothetical protein